MAALWHILGLDELYTPSAGLICEGMGLMRGATPMKIGFLIDGCGESEPTWSCLEKLVDEGPFEATLHK